MSDEQEDQPIALPVSILLPCIVSKRDGMRVNFMENGSVEFALFSNDRFMHSVIISSEDAGDLAVLLNLHKPGH